MKMPLIKEEQFCNKYAKRNIQRDMVSKNGGKLFQKELEKQNIMIIGRPKEKKQIRRIFEKNPELIKDAEGTVFFIDDDSGRFSIGSRAKYQRPDIYTKNVVQKDFPQQKGHGDIITFAHDVYTTKEKPERMLRHELQHKKQYFKDPEKYRTELELQNIFTKNIEKREREDLAKLGLYKGVDKSKISEEQLEKAYTIVRKNIQDYYSFPQEYEAQEAEKVIPERKIKVPKEKARYAYQQLFTDKDDDGIIAAAEANDNNINVHNRSKNYELLEEPIIPIYTRQKIRKDRVSKNGGKLFQKELEKRNIIIDYGSNKERKKIRRLFEKNPELIKDAEGTSIIVAEQRRMRGLDAKYISPSSDIKEAIKEDIPQYKGEGDIIAFADDIFTSESKPEFLLKHELTHKKQYFKNPEQYEKEFKLQNIFMKNIESRERADVAEVGIYPGVDKSKISKEQWNKARTIIRKNTQDYYSFPQEYEAKEAEKVIPERKIKVPEEKAQYAYQQLFKDKDGDGIIAAADANDTPLIKDDKEGKDMSNDEDELFKKMMGEFPDLAKEFEVSKEYQKEYQKEYRKKYKQHPENKEKKKK